MGHESACNIFLLVSLMSCNRIIFCTLSITITIAITFTIDSYFLIAVTITIIISTITFAASPSDFSRSRAVLLKCDANVWFIVSMMTTPRKKIKINFKAFVNNLYNVLINVLLASILNIFFGKRLSSLSSRKFFRGISINVSTQVADFGS